MVIEIPPMTRKGHDHVCIGLGCFLLALPSFFGSLKFNSMNVCCCAVATIVPVLIINMYPSAIRRFSKTVGYVTPAAIHTPYTEPQLDLFLYQASK